VVEELVCGSLLALGGLEEHLLLLLASLHELLQHL
jgi:hypothetical protein